LYFYPIVAGAAFLHDEISMEPSPQDVSANFEDLPDRRGTSRFPVHEDVKYTVLQSKSLKSSGTGKTLNFGSRGILFTTEEKLPLGHTVELSVNWPARLGGTCALQFVATGRVVRAEPQRAAVRIERYEFKTRLAPGAGVS